MGILTTLFWFVLMLGVLVLVHELGHFITAKRAGVKVQEFGVGYPPRLFAIKRGETEYSVNLLPLGGFVKLLGEEDPTEERSLASKGIGTRLIVLSAGSVMNALLPFVLFVVSYMIPKDTVVGPVVIAAVEPGSPAAMAGIQPGDKVLMVNDRRVRSLQDLSYDITLNLGSETHLVLQRGGYEQVEATLVPRWNPPPGQGAIGVRMSLGAQYTETQAYPVWEAVPLGIRKTFDVLTITKNEFIKMFIQSKAPEVAGPVGIAQMTGEVAQSGFGYLVEFTAFLSLNLAVINILPFPMLDGGRIVFVILEGLRHGKRIPPEKEAFVHFVGLLVILTLVIVISYQDVLRIIHGGSTVP